MDQDLSVLDTLGSIGLSEQKAKETAKNEKLCKDLLHYISLVNFIYCVLKIMQHSFVLHAHLFTIFKSEID